MNVVAPSDRTSRAGMPSSSSQGTAFGPRTIAAVEAMLAATQVTPATVTVCQYGSALHPVAGLMM